jgi:hypothetical protein
LDGHMAAEVKALAFNSIGDLLAVGFADGALKVVTFPAMQLVRVLRCAVQALGGVELPQAWGVVGFVFTKAASPGPQLCCSSDPATS